MHAPTGWPAALPASCGASPALSPKPRGASRFSAPRPVTRVAQQLKHSRRSHALFSRARCRREAGGEGAASVPGADASPARSRPPASAQLRGGGRSGSEGKALGRRCLRSRGGQAPVTQQALPQAPLTAGGVGLAGKSLCRVEEAAPRRW
ncbi:hypothetical protein TREES_T100013843 [Tupaia chinensis]|uniref:Uncharacterized protein n=1 Tax=Tupaia chinensis TaxID=246437 RepID=L9KYS1_TUPCH|nr:hypothetical protein TREES_T100013843 [Tupaia chinensis]